MKRFLALMVAVCVIGFASAEEASAHDYYRGGGRGVSAFSIGFGTGGFGGYRGGWGGGWGGPGLYRPSGFSFGYSSFRPSYGYGYGRPVYGGGYRGGYRGCGW